MKKALGDFPSLHSVIDCAEFRSTGLEPVQAGEQ
jgi:hypothetical protein